MPYKVYQDGEKFCVHKMNADNSKGAVIDGGCHGTKEEAAAQARAIYANEKKEITDEFIMQLKEAQDPESTQAILEEWNSRVKELENEEKCMSDTYVPYGIYSFSELDNQREAQEKANELSSSVYDFQSLVGNIVNTPEMMIEGGRLKALDKLYGEFRDRINSDTNENKASKRADVSEADKKRAVGEYGDVNYADETNKKYPIDTEEHIRAAWNYIRMPNNAAKYSDKGASIKRKVIAAWKKKIDPDGPPAAKKDMLKTLEDAIEKVKSWFVDEQEDSGLSIWKEGNQYWWVARYSNKFRDNDHPAEIISSDSHKRFVQLVKEGKAPLPELWLWHKKNWKVGQAHSVAYDDSGFAVAIGTFDVGREDVAEALIKSKESERYLSHGMPFSTIKHDPDDSTILIEHETREISVLPAWAAANKLTGFVVLNLESKEESMAIPDETKQEWISKLGIKPETLQSLEEANAADASKAQSEGIESKENEEAQPAASETETTETQTEAVEAKTVTLTVDELKNAVQDAVKGIVSPMIERLDALEKSLTEVKEASEKRDEALKGTPTASLGALLGGFAQSAIGASETKVDGRTSLAQSKPKETAANGGGRTGIQFIDEMLAGNSQ